MFKGFIGIDPGLTGAFSLLNQEGAPIDLQILPTVLQGGYIKRKVDAFRLYRTLDEVTKAFRPLLFAIEKVWVRPKDSRGSGASLVQSAALCEGVAVGLGGVILRPDPAVWKRAMGLLGKGKMGSVGRCKTLYPLLDLEGDHNKADALLLARFAWLNRDKSGELVYVR